MAVDHLEAGLQRIAVTRAAFARPSPYEHVPRIGGVRYDHLIAVDPDRDRVVELHPLSSTSVPGRSPPLATSSCHLPVASWNSIPSVLPPTCCSEAAIRAAARASACVGKVSEN